MNHVCIARIFAACLLLIGPAGWAADQTVRLVVPPPIRGNLAAMPRIAHPANDAQTRINMASRRLDVRVAEAAGRCKGVDGKPGQWERSVDVPMSGPDYISFVITDSLFCDGPYPTLGTMAIVYDLSTGAPVHWARLLPSGLTGKLTLNEGVDGTKMVTLASKRLFELYLAGYRTGDGAADAPVECREAIKNFTSDGPPAMMVWLDARGAGLAVQFDLPHVAQVCAKPVVISVAALRAEGANPSLLDAIEVAR